MSKKKNNSGRKEIPLADKKVGVTVYIRQKTVTANGGMDAIRKKILEKFDHE